MRMSPELIGLNTVRGNRICLKYESVRDKSSKQFGEWQMAQW